VVSGQGFNSEHPEVIVAFTTSSANIHHPRSYDVEISDKHSGFGMTGLDRSTTVRCGRLWTIDKRKIADVVGTVPDDLLNDIQKLVVDCFPDSSQSTQKS
jgi:mRNA-degrading endonuclease toxin of MazEF toxin-antitoxin module